MKSKREMWNSLDGALSPADFGALMFWIHMIEQDPFRVAEIGSFKGFSAHVFCTLLKGLNYNFTLTCVDIWDAYEDGYDHGKVYDSYKSDGGDSVYADFQENMKILGHEEYVFPMRLPSVEAAKQFPDEHFAIVFIDGAHDVDSVEADIIAWRPKIINNGFMLGHDMDINSVKEGFTRVFGDRAKCNVLTASTIWAMQRVANERKTEWGRAYG